MTTVTERLLPIVAQAARGASPAALDYARFCLLDWYGVTIAGAHEPVVEILAADAQTVAIGQRLIGRDERVGLRDAVLVNGAAGHALDYDDGMEAMMGHPSVAILPALFALAIDRGVGGEALLRAIVAGAEAAGRIGLMMGQDHYSRGFHCTGTVGAMAAALACATLLELDPGTTAIALGLAGTRAAGLKASFGTDGKPLHAGWAALVALTSVQWAQRGMTGAADILGHHQGLGRSASDGFDAERGLRDAPLPYVQLINFKYHAACGITHPAIDGARALRADPGFSLDRLERVTLDVSPEADKTCNIRDPRTGLELKFSLRGTTAMVLAGTDTANPASYSEEVATDPRLHALIEKITVRFEPTFKLGRTRVRFDHADGTSAEQEASLDAFDRDPSHLRERLSGKFASLVAPRFRESGAAALITEILDQPGGPRPAELLQLVREQEPT